MPDSRSLSHVDAAVDADAANIPATSSPDGFVPLRVKHVVRETRDAISLVLDVPESSVSHFGYQAGQFLTLLVCVNGLEHRRCY